MDSKKAREYAMVGLIKHSEPVLKVINDSGDDGVSLDMLVQKTGKKKEHLLRFLIPYLVRTGKVQKHKKLKHYFPVIEEDLVVEKTPEKKMTWFGKLIHKLMYE